MKLIFLVVVVITVVSGGAKTGRADEEEVRRWLARASSAHMWYIYAPSEEFNVWLPRGKRLCGVEPALRTLLATRDQTVDLPLVAYALGFLGNSNSVPVLIGTINSEDWALRILSVVALGELRDVRAVKPLGSLLGVERDVNVRANIVVALRKIGGATAVSFLETAARDEDAFVRKIAKDALTTNECDSSVRKPRLSKPRNCGRSFGRTRCRLRRRWTSDDPC
jgi:HEAT repeat protein